MGELLISLANPVAWTHILKSGGGRAGIMVAESHTTKLGAHKETGNTALHWTSKISKNVGN